MRPPKRKTVSTAPNIASNSAWLPPMSMLRRDQEALSQARRMSPATVCSDGVLEKRLRLLILQQLRFGKVDFLVTPDDLHHIKTPSCENGHHVDSLLCIDRVRCTLQADFGGRCSRDEPTEIRMPALENLAMFSLVDQGASLLSLQEAFV
ncbi:hypothetical protein OBBRIDRAFT_298139 [Obba rivulosa]|uniref:Uncharacterized protein n=1 Tax=Obba rivulosa TaxID=1052685 RepID=A0A8E2DH82_9APHY|nr:hypothetical protein OBBRIDRAFT_298139 [Obba rivulosa]